MTVQDSLFRIGQADTEILQAINRFHYMTSSQISRLLYPKCQDNNRYSQRRLKSLTEAGYLMRLNELPTPRYGSAPRIFTLARKGRRFIKMLGYEVPPYFRPSEESDKGFNNPFIMHTLETIDVLIAAQRLCREYRVSCPNMLSERELKRETVRVFVPNIGGKKGRKVTVIPDAWFQMAVDKAPIVSIALELDRGTEERKRWRQKVAALAEWAKGPYREVFNTDNLTIAVVTTTEFRRNKLREWTAKELSSRNLDSLNEIFLFTEASPREQNTFDFFFKNIWYLPHTHDAVSLLDQPPRVEGVSHATTLFS